MDISCVYCGESDSYRIIHRHMVDEHVDQVETSQNEAADKKKYTIQCPYCAEVIERNVKPRNQDPGFLQEFKVEIAMVAFDRLIYHLVEDHPEKLGLDPELLDQIE